MRLFHFSDVPAIETFVPRPVRVPAIRPEGMEWLNGPLVWAIEDDYAFMYLFPRDCPRILLWSTEHTTAADKSIWLGENRAVAYVEQHRLTSLQLESIYRYELPTRSFESLHDAGMWVSRDTVVPLRMDRFTDLPAALEAMGVELRVVESLVPFRHLWNSSLHVSGIRLKNARGWIT